MNRQLYQDLTWIAERLVVLERAVTLVQEIALQGEGGACAPPDVWRELQTEASVLRERARRLLRAASGETAAIAWLPEAR